VVTTASRNGQGKTRTKELPKSRAAQRTSIEDINEAMRDHALQRLMMLLEAETRSEQPTFSLPTHCGEDALTRLSRLRAARASYGLANMTDMERVASGAWVRLRD